MPLPLSATYTFTPLIDRIEKAREEVAAAERKAANAHAAADAKPDDAALAETATEADEALDVANEALDSLEAELAENPDQPKYVLRVPTFDLNAKFEEEMIRHPTYPSDRKMFKAIEASGLIPADDPDLIEVRAGLRKSGGGVPEELAGVFQDLYDRASDAPEVGAIRAARLRWQKDLARLRTNFYLLSFSGVVDVDGNDVPFEADGDGKPTEAALNAIPPDDIIAIGEKVSELNTLKGRRGNSRGKANASALPPPSLQSRTATVIAETTEIPATP